MFNLVPDHDERGGHRPVSRRTLLKGLGLAGAAGVAAGLGAVSAIGTAPPRAVVRQAPGYRPWLWSDPRAWADGRVPGPRDHAIVTRPMLVEGTVSVAAVTIEMTGALIFSPHSSTRVESAGNVVVAGRLVMRPDSAAVEHVLAFPSVDETRFVGGGMQVLDSDVGLWVIEEGILDAVGTPRVGWNRTGTDPTWRAGDQVHVAPQGKGDYTTFAPFPPGSAVPQVLHDGTAHNSEVFNLTRNVRVEGSPSGRTHVMFLHAMRPQTIKHVALRHMGPLAGDRGRYGLHFHHCGDASRGSLVEGVVVRDCGNHAFVPHASHGVTFRDCVAYNVGADAYWWDPDTRWTYPANASHDVVYDRCLAAKVYPRDPSDGIVFHRLTGFFLGQGTGNTCVDCAAVGVQGGPGSSGFHWPESANLLPNIWGFQRAVAHNNASNGVFVWQNSGDTDSRHLVNQLVCYRNGHFGVDHGAYANAYEYAGLVCFDNGQPVQSLANSVEPGQFWRDADLDASGASHSLRIVHHSLPPTVPIVLDGVRMRGHSASAVQIAEHNTIHPGRYDFVRCTDDGRNLEARSFEVVYMHPESEYRVQHGDGTAFQLLPDGSSQRISAFA